MMGCDTISPIMCGSMFSPGRRLGHDMGYDDSDFTASLMCCACGGGLLLSPSPQPSPQPSTSPHPSPAPGAGPASCGSGNSWFLSAYEGNCNSACSNQGMVCISQPAASKNSACIEELATDNGLTCSSASAGSATFNPTISNAGFDARLGSCYYSSTASSSESFCSASFGSYYRFCPCALPGPPSLPSPPPPPPPPPCFDTDNGAQNNAMMGCDTISPIMCGSMFSPGRRLGHDMGYDDSDFTASLMCCACGGGLLLSPSPQPSPQPSTSPQPSPAPGAGPASCGSGNSWFLSAYEGNCNSACSNQGMVCISQPAASKNSA